MSPDEVETFLAKQSQLYKEGKLTEQQYSDALKDAAAAQKGYTEQLRASMAQLKTSVLGVGSAMVDGKSGASVYNDSIKDAANAVDSFASKFGIVGKVIGTLITAGAKYVAAVNQQADALFKTYQDISRSGLAVGMDDTFKNLQSMGYTVKELGNMSKLLKDNTETLINLGGSAAEGTKQFAGVAKDIQSSNIGTQFKRMGMSVDDINSGIAGYMKMQQLTGATQKQTMTQMRDGAADYIEKQDKLTKLSGAAAAQQQEIVAQAMRQQQFAVTQYTLKKQAEAGDLEAQKKLEFNNNMMIMLTKKFGAGVAADYAEFASGNLVGKGAQRFQRAFKGTASMIKSGGTDYRTAIDQSGKDAKEYLKNTSNLASVGMAETIGPAIGEMVKGVGATAESMEEGGKSADKQVTGQKAGSDAAVKANVDLTTKQRNATMVLDGLTNKGIVPVTAGMEKLASGLDALATPLQKLMGQKDIGVGSGPAKGAAPSPGPAKGSAPGATPAPGAAPGGAALPVDKIIDFGGGTGDQAHFNQLNSTVLNSFTSMAQEYYNTTGKKLRVNSAFRSPEEQAKVNSGTNPKAAPGKSLHNQGKAVDINSNQVSELTQSGLLGKYGFSPLNNDPPHIQMPSAADGGILSGPKGGFSAMLHGNEAVVPLPDGNTIPVQMASGSGASPEQLKLLSMKISKLNILIKSMEKHYNTSSQILRQQS
jgi:hypothetical protein